MLPFNLSRCLFPPTLDITRKQKRAPYRPQRTSIVSFNLTGYLTRTQLVFYNDIESPVLRVPTGIGQGTILGPLIFIFYLNDVVDKLYYVKISMYADDCVLYLSGNNWDSIRDKIQEHWGELNNLHLNVNKTKVMIAGTHTKLSRLGDVEPLQLYDNDVGFVKQYNYLGVILDAEMSLRPFLTHVRKLVYIKIFSFTKIRNYLTEHAAIMVYKLFYLFSNMLVLCLLHVILMI